MAHPSHSYSTTQTVRPIMSSFRGKDCSTSVPWLTGHLPKLLRDLAVRLRVDSESPSPPSQAARDHGALRHQQGYTAAMVVEESRILQMSIFSTLQRNLSGVDFSRLLLDVVTIADEVDSQLKQAMFSYVTPMTSKSQTARLAG